MRISSTGNVGIGTTAPQSRVDVASGTGGSLIYPLTLRNGAASTTASTGSGLAFSLNTGATHHAEINTVVSNVGTGASDLYFTTYDGSSPTEKLRIQAGGFVGIGSATPAYTLDVAGTIHSGTGGVVFPDGTTQTTAAFSSTCRTGYVLVPNDGKFSFKDFCVMKYAASQDSTTKLATSVTANTPWASLTWYEAKDQCQRVGTHLMTEGEWMTVARNIEATAINNLDGSNPVHLATGHSDNSPASALAATTDPSMASCNVSYALNHANNTSCALKSGTTGTGSYYGEGAGNYYTGTYTAGAVGMAQMRTFVLSNSNIIWDVAGNIWQWTDMQCGTTAWPASGAWWDWSNGSLTSAQLFAGPSGSEIGTGGAGRYYGCSAVGNAMLRGGDWSGGANVGVFAAYLSIAPSFVSTRLGFRCAYAP